MGVGWSKLKRLGKGFKAIGKKIGSRFEGHYENFMDSPAGDIASSIPIVGDIVGSAREREQQRYDRALNEQLQEREDTAVSRRAADMESAGINPLMAAGAPAQTGSMARSSAPERGGEQMSQVLAMMRTKADVDKTKAQEKLIETQADVMRRQESRAQDMHPVKLRTATANASRAEIGELIDEQRRLMAVYGVESAYQAHVERQLYRAWQAGEDSMVFRRTTESDKDWSIDLSNIRYSEQLKLVANQVALEMNRARRDVAKKDAAWYEFQKISNLVWGSSGVFSSGAPYVFEKQPTKFGPNSRVWDE